MNAVEFVKKFGWSNARYYLWTASKDAITVSFNMPEHGLEYITLNVKDLKSLVDSYELVKNFGGLNGAKEYLKGKFIQHHESAYIKLKQAIENVEKCQ